ncbi:hypothetical protein ESA94_15465 [Lacibacter luteus]|uniref:DUF4625 domain-containing protein n=1 Tax=Lacibacter luteus TaxID=2508719 RepID=A0A4Q1CFV4_9BACT|nr:hypothetical protein [Lacibacter luteus]RXK58787.1 hypothetical protein ESA94_15465 [Lacibacter luteus]
MKHLNKQYLLLTFFLFIAALFLLVSCSKMNTAGIKKDFNTGLSASYKNMEPGNVLLIMNNEVLNHTDIPVGEQFILANDGIKGLTEKNGYVQVGCALTISNKKGEVLLQDDDLFADKDRFKKEDAQMLKCTVNTGLPMQSDEDYNVSVVFWDKNGTGRIENKVTIHMIDMP